MKNPEEVYKIGDVKPPLPIKPMPEAPWTVWGWFKKFGPALIVTSLGISGFEAMQAPSNFLDLYSRMYFCSISSL
jgi:hypothetical protein